MVKEEQYKGKTIFVCEHCNFGYETEKLANQCEQFCEKYHSCSMEITKHAVKS